MHPNFTDSIRHIKLRLDVFEQSGDDNITISLEHDFVELVYIFSMHDRLFNIDKLSLYIVESIGTNDMNLELPALQPIYPFISTSGDSVFGKEIYGDELKSNLVKLHGWNL